MACLGCQCIDAVSDEKPIGENELQQTSTSFRSVGTDVYRLARETIDLCGDTMDKGQQVVEFGTNVKSTLLDFVTNGIPDASAIDTIRDLIDGDNVKAARALAERMKELVQRCVQKSIEMIGRMQDGVEALPDIVQRQVERAADRVKLTEEEQELAKVEPHINELEECVTAVRDLRLVTALDAGKNAFEGITSKSQVCRTILEAIRKFANALASIMDAIRNIDVAGVISKIKDMLRCIKLGGLMKQLSEGVGRILKLILNLFTESSGKLSALWQALSHAKDKLLESFAPAKSAKSLCQEALDTSGDLEQKTRGFQVTTSRGVGEDALAILSRLGAGNEILDAIRVANTMDEKVANCTLKVTDMVDSVTTGYTDLPEIVTGGIGEMIEAGASEDDPDPADVEEDVQELVRARGAIEQADMMTAVVASRNGFDGTTEKVEKTRALLSTFNDFASKCIETIQSFLGTWNLEFAKDKIIEMCRLVRLGEMMKQFASQIRKLLQAIISLLQSIVGKAKTFSVPDSLEDTLNAAANFAKDGFNNMFNNILK